MINKQNVLDSAIQWVAPVYAAKRMKARAVMAVAGNYHGASRSRRAMQSWNVNGADADGSMLDDLPDLRERTRDLIRNAPLAGGVINSNVTNIVGPGLNLKPSIDAEFLGLTEEAADELEKNLVRYWSLWANSKECDSSGTQTFNEIEGLVLRSAMEGGDCFTLLPAGRRSRNYPFSLRVNVIEAEQVSNKDLVQDTSTLSGGIQRNESGKVVSVHVMRRHPGSVDGSNHEWDVVPLRGSRTGRLNILHHYNKVRPGQHRGIPYLASVIEPFKQLERYTNAELMAAVVSAMFTVFVKSESGESLDVFESDGAESSTDGYQLGNGAIVGLSEGEDVSIVNPGRPNSMYDPFVQSILRQIGVNLEIPPEVMLKQFVSSYSAARGAIMEAWRFYRNRRDWLVNSLCQPVYETLVDELVSVGAISAPGYFSDPLIRASYLGAKWIGRPQGQLDPLREMKANVIAENRSWKTAEENTTELTGGDWNVNVRQRAKENEMMIESGLVMVDDPDGDENGEDDGTEKEEVNLSEGDSE